VEASTVARVEPDRERMRVFGVGHRVSHGAIARRSLATPVRMTAAAERFLKGPSFATTQT
jgi:hypothetical protein